MAKRKPTQEETETTNPSADSANPQGGNTMSEETSTAPAQKRDRRFNFIIEGTTVSVEEIASGEKLTYDFATLPPEIQAQLGPFGLSAKFSNASAGKSGEEAKTALNKVWEALAAGQWSTRAPAEKKLTASDLKAQLENMSDADKQAAQALLAKLGMKLG